MGDYAIIELQNEALSNECDIANLVRKSYVIARKLGLKDFGSWLSHELNGYENFKGELPNYRVIKGELKGWNPYHGWIPVIIPDDEFSKIICTQKVINSLDNLCELAKSDDHSIRINLNAGVANIISEMIDFKSNYSVFLSYSHILSLIDRVRSIILEWLLKLEEEGILGEGMMFSKDEKQIAETLGNVTNNFYGNITDSQIQQQSNNSTQTYHKEIDYLKIKDLLTELSDHKNDLDLSVDAEDTLDKEISNLNTLLDEPQPDNNKINSSLISIKGIIEGVAGGLISNGLLYMISEILA